MKLIIERIEDIKMRRRDREITDSSKLKEIISNCYVCRIGFNDDGEVYIVPLNFGYTYDNDTYTFYFHGAKDGRKIDLIHKNPKVGFELDTNYKLNEDEIACEYSARFQSIIGNGVISIIDDMEEKREGLLAIMEHNTGRRDFEFIERMINGVCVFKLEVTSMACKEHL